MTITPKRVAASVGIVYLLLTVLIIGALRHCAAPVPTQDATRRALLDAHITVVNAVTAHGLSTALQQEKVASAMLAAELLRAQKAVPNLKPKIIIKTVSSGVVPGMGCRLMAGDELTLRLTGAILQVPDGTQAFVGTQSAYGPSGLLLEIPVDAGSTTVAALAVTQRHFDLTVLAGIGLQGASFGGLLGLPLVGKLDWVAGVLVPVANPLNGQLLGGLHYGF